MILINFKYGQGLGNQLCLLLTGLSLAIKNNKKLIIENYRFFLGKDFIKLKNIIIFEKSHNFKGLKYHEYFEPLFYDSELKTHISLFDENLFKLNFNENIYLNGLFQSEKYIQVKKEYILHNHISILESSFKINEKTCVINIRGGEYKRHQNLILPLKYWKKAIEILKKKIPSLNFIIVTDDFNYSKKLFPNLTIIHQSISDCFLVIRQAKYLILSNSSFPLIPIFFSEKNNKNIIAPYLWSRFDNKKKIWCSPTNYNQNWTWIDHNGRIINNSICINSINYTNEYVSSNLKNSSVDYHSTNFNTIEIIVLKIKRIIKKLLNNFLPNVF